MSLRASSALRAILVGAALISCVAATHAAFAPLTGRLEERLLLDPATARGVRGNVVTTAAHAGKIDVLEWALESGVSPLPQDASDNELTAASQALVVASGADKQVYEASAFRWLESRGFNPPLQSGAVVELTSNLVRFGDVGLLDRYVRIFRTKNAFDPNAKQRGIPLVYAANTVPMLEYLEAQGATLDVPSVDEALEMLRQAVSKMSGLFGPRPGRALSIGTMIDAMEPTRRANPLENPGLDYDARLYLLSKGLRPQGDAVLYAVLAGPTDLAIVDVMLEAGADLNALRQNGSTTLHGLVSRSLRDETACTRAAREARICAVETVEQRAQIMRYLVERGADPTLWDKNGISALDAARRVSDEERRRAYVSALSPKP